MGCGCVGRSSFFVFTFQHSLMSRFYAVTTKSISEKKCQVVLTIKVCHPDYNLLSDSIGYALQLITDHSGYQKTIFSEYVDSNKLCDKNWIRDNAGRFIASCVLLEQKAQPLANDSILEDPLLEGHLQITCTHPAWMQHLIKGATWDSVAFEYAIKDYKVGAPAIPDYSNFNQAVAALKNITVDYKNQEGWLPIQSSYLKGNMRQRPAVVYVPAYSFTQQLNPSYTCDHFYQGGNALKEMLSSFDLKTVIIKDKYKGPDQFGVCVVQGNMVLLQQVTEEKLYYTPIAVERIKAIGLAQFNRAVKKPYGYRGFLKDAQPVAG